MSATSKNALHIGEEVTYNTAVTPTRSYPVSADGWALSLSTLNYDEMIAGQVAGAASDVEYFERGGEGTIPKTLRTSGDGLLWKAALGSSSIATTVQTHETAADASDVSLTVQMVKSEFGGGSRVHTFPGASITDWSLEHSPGDVLKGEFNFYWGGAYTDQTAEAVAAYPADVSSFKWDELTIDISGTVFKGLGFSFSVNNNLNTDRDYLATARPSPCREGKLEASGSIEVPSDSDANDVLVNALANGVESLTLTWQKPAGGAMLKIVCPAIRVEPKLGEASADELTKTSLDFMVVDDPAGSAPAVSVIYDTKIDTAF